MFKQRKVVIPLAIVLALVVGAVGVWAFQLIQRQANTGLITVQVEETLDATIHLIAMDGSGEVFDGSWCESPGDLVDGQAIWCFAYLENLTPNTQISITADVLADDSDGLGLANALELVFYGYNANAGNLQQAIDDCLVLHATGGFLHGNPDSTSRFDAFPGYGPQGVSMATGSNPYEAFCFKITYDTPLIGTPQQATTSATFTVEASN